jgi:hypothetical protein
MSTRTLSAAKAPRIQKLKPQPEGHVSVQQALHDSNINSTISSMFDGGWVAAIGDYLSGWKSSGHVGSYQEAETWLDKKARELFPKSGYSKRRSLH